jgi:hypothetical protein
MTEHRDPEVLVTAGFVLVTRSTDGVRRTNSFIYHTGRCAVVQDIGRDKMTERLVERLDGRWRECKLCEQNGKKENKKTPCPYPGCDKDVTLTATHIRAEHDE